MLELALMHLYLLGTRDFLFEKITLRCDFSTILKNEPSVKITPERYYIF